MWGLCGLVAIGLFIAAADGKVKWNMGAIPLILLIFLAWVGIPEMLAAILFSITLLGLLLYPQAAATPQASTPPKRRRRKSAHDDDEANMEEMMALSQYEDKWGHTNHLGLGPENFGFGHRDEPETPAPGEFEKE
jgi:hypothetical protein